MNALLSTAPSVCCMPLEVKTRDLDARLHLGLKCLREGYSCLIGPKAGVHQAMFQLGCRPLYFDKGMSVDNDPFYDQILAQGGAIILLAEEGGVYAKDYKWVEVAYDKPRINEVDLICMWGTLQRDRLLQARTDLDPARIPVTGHPRFDMRKPQFNTYYNSLNNCAAQHKPYVLCNTNFGVGNNPMPIEELIAFYKKMYANTPHKGEANLKPYYDYERKLLPFFVESIKNAAKRFPNLNFVYRPHPAEHLDSYREHFAGISNILLTSSGSVQEWILHAELVVHHDCTTAIEAAFNGVRAVSLAPTINHDIAKEVPLLVSDICETTESFFEYLDTISLSPGSLKLSADERQQRLEHARKIIANIDFDASERIVKELHAVQKRMQQRIPSVPARHSFFRKIKRHLRLLRLRFGTTAVTKKFPGLKKSELCQRIALLRNLDPAIPEVTCKQVTQHTFLLEGHTN